MSIINKTNMDLVANLLECEKVRSTKTYSIVVEYNYDGKHVRNVLWGYRRKDGLFRFYTISNALTPLQKRRLHGNECNKVEGVDGSCGAREFAFYTNNIDDIIEVIISCKRYLGCPKIR